MLAIIKSYGDLDLAKESVEPITDNFFSGRTGYVCVSFFLAFSLKRYPPADVKHNISLLWPNDKVGCHSKHYNINNTYWVYNLLFLFSSQSYLYILQHVISYSSTLSYSLHYCTSTHPLILSLLYFLFFFAPIKGLNLYHTYHNVCFFVNKKCQLFQEMAKYKILFLLSNPICHNVFY